MPQILDSPAQSSAAPHDPSPDGWMATAQSTLECEAQALLSVAARLDRSFVRAIELILACSDKVVISGLGKSGLVAQKIAATFCSTGTPALFLHPTEALHGDLGIYRPGDVTILISNSGTTHELLRLVPLLRRLESPIIGIIGNRRAPLAVQADVCLDASVTQEADPLRVAPTSSAIVAMALGDALTSVLMAARHLATEDYARWHPGGQLGRNLLVRVKEVMHTASQVAWVSPEASLKEVVLAMTDHPLGAACVVKEPNWLLGVITDGDIRRAFQMHDDIRGLSARGLMTRKPITVRAEATLREALHLMEARASQISVLPVIDAQDRCLGLVRIHDILRPEAQLCPSH